MAMLAEPRRKKRYNLVPKGKALFEDSDRFGTKMLEKMGWSKGKGLGSNEDGQQDFIRIRYKNDADGLGFIERDDQWTEHEKHFNGLLDSLNGENTTTNNASDESKVAVPTAGFGFKSKSGGKEKLTDKFSGQSLEEKSKNSKARVHYKKFTKGKDMAQYSEKDLANIFGKKASPDDENIYSQFQAFNAGDDIEESVPLESGTNIINTGVSVSDYFKMKMEAKKGVANGVDIEKDEVPVKKKKSKKQSTDNEVEEQPKCSENPTKELGTQIVNTGVSVNDYFKAKMEALKQKKRGLVENAVDNEDEAEDDIAPIEEAPRKKKKKQPVNVSVEEISSAVEVAEVSKDLSSKKKKKTKNVIAIQVEPESSTVPALPVEDEDGIPSKKKKNKKRSAEEIASTDTECSTNIPKKIKMESPDEPAADTTEIGKKKKKKQIAEIDIEDDAESVQFGEQSSSKKKQPSVKNESEEQNETTPIVDEIEARKLTEGAKKKKKSSNVIQIQGESETSTVALSEDGIPSKKKKNKKRSVAEQNESESQTTISTGETPADLPLTTKMPKKKQTNSVIAAEPPPKKKTNSNATTPIEKFRNIELHQFHASTISQINGYGLSENLQLKIKTIKNDEERIVRLWNGTLDKYQYATSKHKIYNNYMTKAREARRTKHKIPQIKVKCLKRKHVFQCL